MKAIILAAGSSKRLRPICDSIPKSLITVNGESLIERNVDNLLSSGVECITIVAGYLKETIIRRLKDRYKKIKFVENPVYDRSGSGYSLYLGMKSINSDDQVVFTDADILYHPLIIKEIKEKPHLSFLYVGQQECNDEAVKVVVDEKGIVKRISKSVTVPYGCAGESIGIVKLNSHSVPDILKLLQGEVDKDNLDFEWEHIFDNNIDSICIHSKITKLPWIEIDFPEDIIKAEEIAKRIANSFHGI